MKLQAGHTGPQPALEAAVSTRSSASFYWNGYLEIKIVVPRVLIAAVVSPPKLFSGRSKEI